MSKFKLLSIGLLVAGLAVMAIVGLPGIGEASTYDLVGPGFAIGGAGMIFSEQLKFSEDQDISQVVGTYNSTNIIDTGAPGTVFDAAAALDRNVGPGNPVPILIQMTETLVGATATLQFQIETADEEAMDTTNVVIAQSRLYAVGECVAGKQFGIAYLPNDCLRYLRVNYLIGTATTTAGTVTAGIVKGVQTNS